MSGNMATELAAGPTADKVARPDPYFEGQADVVESFLFDKAKKKEPVLHEASVFHRNKMETRLSYTAVSML